MLPSFDVVRISEQGDAVIAGRAAPQSKVVIKSGESEIGQVIADEQGEWVFVPSQPLPPGTTVLSLEAQGSDGVNTRSVAPVVLILPENAKEEPSLAVKTDPEGRTEILSPPKGENAGPLSVEAVNRTTPEDVLVQGHASPESEVLVYLDNALVGRSPTGPNGDWRIAMKSEGGQMLRADMVDPQGKVQARLELPVETMPMVMEGITVSKGDSLWRIASRLYGSGPAYTVIYRANRERIRDPDMVYPGQVFQVPRP